MLFVDDLESGKKAILSLYPKFSCMEFKADNSGWTNFVIKVDNKYIFRFPRNNEAFNSINKEYKVLNILNKRLPDNIRVPNYIFNNLNSDYPFVGYEMINGEFLTKEVFASLSYDKKEKILNCMSCFLNALHKVDYGTLNLKIINPVEWYKKLYAKIKIICFKYFDDVLKSKTNELFKLYFSDETMFNYKPTLVHGDLSEDHIIITEDGIGVIDFGDLMVFDPAYDFIWAYICDKNFYNKLLDKYNGNKDNNFEHRIRDFHSIRPPYDGIIYADSINNIVLIEEEIKKLICNLN